MGNTTVRASERAHDVIRRLAKSQATSLTEALDTITTQWERARFFDELNEAFGSLRADESAWKAETTERDEWDRTLLDDLDEHESF